MGMTFAGRVVQEPGPELDTCRRLGFPTDWAELANRFENPLGTRSGVGHVLMLRQDLDVLNGAGLLNQPNDLTVSDSTNTRTLKNLHVVSTRCITPGYPNDPAAVHLVELADSRRLLRLTPANVAYNVRQTPSGTFHPGTIVTWSSGPWVQTPYTWDQLWANLWAKAPAQYAGSAPALPATPDGTPEGFDFYGWTWTDAVAYVLHRLGLALCRDPFADTYTLVQPGATQAGLAAAETGAMSVRQLDIEPVDTWLGSMPRFVDVYFRKQGGREAAFGDTPFSVVSVYAGDVGYDVSQTYGTEILFDELPATTQPRFGGDQVTNAADLQARAAARATEFLRTRQAFQGREYRKAYSGFLNAFATGSQVRSVAWQDLAGGLCEGGPLTVVDRTPYRPDPFARWPAAGDGWVGTGLPWHLGTPERPWQLVGLAVPDVNAEVPPTGYENYRLEMWSTVTDHAAQMNRNANDSAGAIQVWRPTTMGGADQRLHEMALVVGFKSNRPVVVTVSDSDDKGAGTVAGAVPALGSTTFADVVSTDQTGVHLVVGYVHVTAAAAATVTFAFQAGSVGTLTVPSGLVPTVNIPVGGGDVYVPVVQIIQVTGLDAATTRCKLSLKASVTAGGAVTVSTTVLDWARL
jgi:hypothetical protein